MDDLLVAQNHVRLMPDPSIAVSDIEGAIDAYLKSIGNRQLLRQLEHPKGMLEIGVL